MSWIAGADESEFPLQNIPFGVYFAADGRQRCATRVGDSLIDLHEMAAKSFFSLDATREALRAPTLNAFAALGSAAWADVRASVQRLFSASEGAVRDDAALRAAVIHPVVECRMALPMEVGDYTDFYASREHASNLGKMLRPGQPPLLPNYLHIPIGYHGRASTLVPSGTPVRRPRGQTCADGADAPTFGPCRLMDFELEVAAWVGPGNAMGTPIEVARAGEHIFGLTLFNDWSARDIQKWEYVPLGPFLSKSFASTVSPWIITLQALAPFRVEPPPREVPVLPYLMPGGDNYNLQLRVTLNGSVISRCSFGVMYWTFAQMLAHHTSNGCAMRPGDVLASGTVSGTEPGTFGSMMELSWRGERPLTLPDGSVRKFLQDGDTVEMAGECVADGYRIGFGPCSGTVLPALA